MKEMKLISMTDFVILIDDKGIDAVKGLWDFNVVVTSYAKFLTQPLTLGIFIPCVDGVPIEEPTQTEKNEFGGAFASIEEQAELYSLMEQYQQAKEKVLFEGFEIVKSDFENVLMHINENKYIGTFANGEFLFSYKSIEQLTTFNPTLTQSAIKQIGI